MPESSGWRREEAKYQAPGGAVLSVGLPMPAVADWRNPSADNKMSQPLEWSTLDEAAAWLTGRTGKQWGARAVLNAAIRYPVGDNPAGASNLCTAIGVALPQGHVIKHAVVNVGEGRAELERLQRLPDALKNEPVITLFASGWRPVALLQLEVRQLLAARWVEVSTARAWSLIEREYWRIDIIDPPFVARLEDVGIPRSCLINLAEKWKAEQLDCLGEAAIRTVDSEKSENPKNWARGIRAVAFDAAKGIVTGNIKLTAAGLEKEMLDSGKVELKNDEYQLKSIDGSLNDREMKAKPATIAGWVTALKKLLEK